MKLLLALALLVLTFSSKAGSGNELYEQYLIYQGAIKGERTSIEDVSKGAHYMGYVYGVASTLSADGKICIPENVTTAQLADVVGKFLDDSPAIRNKESIVLTYAALLSSFRCEEE
ncbi:Rap1a/Tai family immunity protein [Brumicola blandensis]|uniref:Rap1a/Tai family immunity protein n=1 Tax=Brumicola blandensis TaxID=3075611 RepID=A0AAW8QY49_9ALTE|nr:Rap1a/Tai family immunity protein [Alteromonas sp. W409]MDT0581434.1 Rap1a/Tai family immunity protein [Alteromonas sp. W409]